MVDLKKKSDCCGCEACAQICPVGALKMKRDREGFSYPIVSKKKCINCGLCEKICPVKNYKTQNDSDIDCYLAKNLGSERLDSSSGGIFVLLAKWILENDGIVYGAAFDSEWMVHHFEVKNFKELKMIMGSKYLQSCIDGKYIEVKGYLESGKKVLFSGTACQIEGLKNYLKHDYDNLYTIDILCHGVPSPLVWRKYLNELRNKYKSEITDIFFREKSHGWHEYSTKIVFDDGRHFAEKFTSNVYMKMFLRNYILRPSCYSCRFKSINRASDITLGDAWGIESTFPQFDDDKGVSIILLHTNKGRELFKQISGATEYFAADIELVLPSGSDSRKSVKIPRGRALLFSRFIRNKSISKMADSMEYSYKNKILTRIVRNHL